MKVFLLILLLSFYFNQSFAMNNDATSVANRQHFKAKVIRVEIIKMPNDFLSKRLKYMAAIYIVYIENKNEIYKLVSLEDIRIDKSYCKEIKKGNSYKFKIKRFVPEEVDLPSAGFFLGVNDGHLIEIKPEKNCNLYIPLNLNGLCINESKK